MYHEIIGNNVLTNRAKFLYNVLTSRRYLNLKLHKNNLSNALLNAIFRKTLRMWWFRRLKINYISKSHLPTLHAGLLHHDVDCKKYPRFFYIANTITTIF